MEKVSIIMPAYNCEEFIVEAIRSVQNQTYPEWELIIIDDCSKDRTFETIDKCAIADNRIRVLKNETNLGAALSRNRGVEVATGEYIAFLDSDDVWFKNKLEKQISFMTDNNYLFTCTSYDKINTKSEPLGIVVKALTVNYEGLLRRCPGNSTVIYNCDKLGKFIIPSIKKRNDYLMWLRVIKKAGKLYGLNDVLGSHRIGMQSISSNKASLVKYHWIIYRNHENLSVIKSLYLCCFWIAKSLFHL